MPLNVVLHKDLYWVPLYFLLYVNDICNISNLLFSTMYADHISVLHCGKKLKLFNLLDE